MALPLVFVFHGGNGLAFGTMNLILIGKVTHDFGSADIWEFFKAHPKP